MEDMEDVRYMVLTSSSLSSNLSLLLMTNPKLSSPISLFGIPKTPFSNPFLYISKSKAMEKGTLIQLVSLLLTISGLGRFFCHAAGEDFDYNLFLCSKYILRGGLQMFEYCCSGLKSLYYNDTTNAYLVNTCDCMKPEFANYTRADEKRAANIENLCNLKLPFRFARNVNCSSVNATPTRLWEVVVKIE